jgi:hypothetical protein
MFNGINLIQQNTGVSFEWYVLLIIILGSLIFMAKDFKLGLIILFTLSAAVFVWFYQMGYEWTMPLATFFISLILLALSLFAVSTTSTTGGFN